MKLFGASKPAVEISGYDLERLERLLRRALEDPGFSWGERRDLDAARRLVLATFVKRQQADTYDRN